MNHEQMVIELNHIEFRWKPTKPLILAIEKFSIQQGARVFIKGASGSGKSTLLSLLGGVLSPQQGEIKVLGKAINKMGGASRDEIGRASCRERV